MRWSAVVALVLAVVLSGCSSSATSEQPQPSPSPTTASPQTESSPDVATPADLIAKWEPELRGVSDPCIEDVFARACTDSVESLNALAQGVAADADRLDLSKLEARAKRVSDHASDWLRVCLPAMAEGKRPPKHCAVEVHSAIRVGNRGLIGEMYAAKRAS